MKAPLLIAGLAALALAMSRQIPDRLSVGEVKRLAERTTSTYFRAIDPLMVRAIVEIESSRKPAAFRLENHIGDASVGLMQTLVGTAQEMASIRGANAFGVPAFEDLLRPDVSVYFGTAYLNLLRTWNGRNRDKQFIVRGYNGGPGGATKSYTVGYWQKYSAAEEMLRRIDGEA